MDNIDNTHFTDDRSDQLVGKVVFGQVEILSRISEGTFGEVYAGFDRNLNLDCVLKISKNTSERTRLVFENEYKVMKRLKSTGSFLNCSLQTSECSSIGRDMLIMNRLGPNLDEVMEQFGGKYTVATLCHIMIKSISLLKLVHSCGILHRDVKPENFCLDVSMSPNIYLIDFGISCDYIDEDEDHIEQRKVEGFAGTRCFCSINAHKSRLALKRSNHK